MPAYVVLDIDVTDPVTYEEYKQLSPVSLAAYGGTFVARGGQTEVLEGSWKPKRLVILRFESVERAKQWLDSEEYRPARAIRLKAAKTSMIVTEGIA